MKMKGSVSDFSLRYRLPKVVIPEDLFSLREAPCRVDGKVPRLPIKVGQGMSRRAEICDAKCIRCSITASQRVG